MIKKIQVGLDFTTTPIGRFRKDSQYSGQVFREDYLVPALNDSTIEKVIVDLSGVEGYGSSFLEEAFGGLIRAGFDYGALGKRLEIVSSDSLFDRFVVYAKSYIDAAVKANVGNK
ncbi:MAG: STAS-like domain-containing protein [Kiritimatiellaeota bacterium]|nr:STAS-like domain-containing protein [Kiritimatiellota bacterium]